MKKIISKLFRKLGYNITKRKPGFHYVKRLYGITSHKMRDIRDDSLFNAAARAAISRGRTGLYYDRLYLLYQGFKNVINCNPAGEEINIVDLGTYKGGSTYFLAALAEKLAPSRARIWSVDTFMGYSEKDLPRGIEGEYLVPGKGGDVDFEDVSKYLSRFKFVNLIKSRIQDCAGEFSKKRFHFIHLDVNLYEPTKFSLSFFGERMNKRGIIIVDDYQMVTCPGVKKAVDEYVSKNKTVVKFGLLTGQCILVFYK